MDPVTLGFLAAAAAFFALGVWDRVTDQQPLHEWLLFLAIPFLIAAALMLFPIAYALLGALRPPAYTVTAEFTSTPYTAGTIDYSGQGGERLHAELTGYRVTGARARIAPEQPAVNGTLLGFDVKPGDLAPLAWLLLLLPAYSLGYAAASAPSLLRGRGARRRAAGGVAPRATPRARPRAARLRARLTPDFRVELVPEG
jgi:hypothetical protein